MMKIDPELLIVVSISEKVKNSKSIQMFYYQKTQKQKKLIIFPKIKMFPSKLQEISFTLNVWISNAAINFSYR